MRRSPWHMTTTRDGSHDACGALPPSSPSSSEESDHPRHIYDGYIFHPTSHGQTPRTEDGRWSLRLCTSSLSVSNVADHGTITDTLTAIADEICMIIMLYSGTI